MLTAGPRKCHDTWPISVTPRFHRSYSSARSVISKEDKKEWKNTLRRVQKAPKPSQVVEIDNVSASTEMTIDATPTTELGQFNHLDDFLNVLNRGRGRQALLQTSEKDEEG